MGGEWTTVPLSELTSTPPTYGVVQPGQDTESGSQMLRVNNFQGHSLNLSEVMRIAPEIEAKYGRTRIQAGDVLLTIVGSVGQVAVVPDELSGWNIARAIAMIRPNKRELSRWISLVLRSPQAQYQLGVNANTTVQTTINLKDLRELRIPLPDEGERGAIAHILGTLDDKIELNHRRNQTLEAMARALFKDWFVDFGPVRAKMEGREPYLPADLWQHFPDRLDDEGKPERWEYRSVGDFAVLTGGKQLEKEKITPTGSVPVFGGAGVMGYTDRYNADGFVIAVGRVGAYCGQFFSHRGKAWINNNASLIRQSDDRIADWLFLSLRHTDIDVIKKGAAQPFVSNGDIAKLPVIWPGGDLLAVFTGIVAPIHQKRDQYDAESRTLAQLRDTLLPKLISGELRITDAEKFIERVESQASNLTRSVS